MRYIYFIFGNVWNEHGKKNYEEELRIDCTISESLFKEEIF